MYQANIRWTEDTVREQNAWRSRCINLIASEQVMSCRARSVMGSDFGHRYAEGHPGERYYQGTEKIDAVEDKVKRLLRMLFQSVHAEVRPISGTNANEAVFSRYIRPGDVVMVNSTPGGGHISHQRAGSVGKYTRNVIDFPLADHGYTLDPKKTCELVRRVRPKLIVLGKSLFLFPEPITEIKEVAEKYKIPIVYDAAHVVGLIAGKQFQQPLKEGADIIVASTHKTFYGPQRGMILSDLPNRDRKRIDKGAFPGSSSNHHLDTLPPLLIATCEMLAFGEEYAKQVVVNAQALGAALEKLGFDVQMKDQGYTRSHQIAVDVSAQGGGSFVSIQLKENDIILNMNMLPHEPLSHHDNPAGVRIGTQEMTRVGMKEAEMEQIADFIAAAVLRQRDVRNEVNAFRNRFQEVHYSFDNEANPNRNAESA